MNPHILLVMKWLKNPESVSNEELVENHKCATAYAAAYAVADDSAVTAVVAASAYAYNAGISIKDKIISYIIAHKETE